ncbi:hypothetical protein PENTCL1PPCAC_20644, partial [Pristionchus entomophagus]
MVRFLATLILLAHIVDSQVPGTCSSCDKTKAALIGKTECDAQGQLVAKCINGQIRMKVEDKYFSFDRVTCINGDWFGT